METALLKSMKALDKSSKELMKRERAEATAKKKKATAKKAKISRHKAQPFDWDKHPEQGDIVISPFLPGAIGTVVESGIDRKRDAMPAFGGTAWVTPQATVVWLYTDSSKEYVDEGGYMEFKAEKRRVTYEQKEFHMLVKVGNIDPEYTIHSFCGVDPRPVEEVRDEINSGRERVCRDTGVLKHHDENHPTCINAEFAKVMEDGHEDQWIQV